PLTPSVDLVTGGGPPQEVIADAAHTRPATAAGCARHDARFDHRSLRWGAVPTAVGGTDRADDGRGDTAQRPLALASRAMGADHPRWPARDTGHLRWRRRSSDHRGAAPHLAALDACARR